MFKGLSVLFSFMMLLIVGCSTNSFVPVHNLTETTTLGQRTVSDPHAFAPGTQRSWLEVCQRQVSADKKKTVTYVEPCTSVILDGTQFATFSPYVTGIATPVIQAGAIVGGAALIGNGLRHSGSTTNNSNGNSNTNTNRARGGTGTENSGEGSGGGSYTNNSGNSGIIGDKNHHNEIGGGGDY